MKFTIPFTTKLLPDSPAKSQGYSKSRWVFEYDQGWFELYVEILKDRDWKINDIIYGLKFTTDFKFEQNHSWYDGPHCYYQFGFVGFSIENLYKHCKKCQKDL